MFRSYISKTEEMSLEVPRPQREAEKQQASSATLHHHINEGSIPFSHSIDNQALT